MIDKTKLNDELNTYIQLIENSQNDEEIFEAIKSILIQNPSAKTISYKLTEVVNSNENDLKSAVINNTENIIKMFNNLKEIKEDFHKSKRGVDSILSQMLILNKKYIEPYDKLNRSIMNKRNLDDTLEIYDKIKNLKENIKMMRLYYEKESLIFESSNAFTAFYKIKKEISDADADITGINILKEDLDWFQMNEEKIMNSFRGKFHDCIQNMENSQISKYLEFFSSLGISYVINEVKNFSNKLLKDLMIEKFFKKVIQGNINTINQLDMITDNIVKIRKEIRDFFSELENWSRIMMNLGRIIQTDFDKNNFVSYDEIMEIEGLRGIYDLFIDKIQSSVLQIVDKLKNNPKFTNAFNYFNKDFIFFYFVLKLYSLNLGIPFNVDNMIGELKSSFMDKFKSSVTENFNRAYNLVKNVERTAENNGKFERENIVNVQIIDHFVKYIKFMSMSFVDLNEEFCSEADLLFNDALLLELQETFSELLIDHYFINIFSKLDIVISTLNSSKEESTFNLLNVQKFYYFYYILYKMNEVFISFLNSNIPFLISEQLQINVEKRMEVYMNQFYNCFLNRIAKDIKMLLINKDFSNFKILFENIKTSLKLFFDSLNYNNNKSYEKFVTKFLLYVYLFTSSLLLLTIHITKEEDLNYVDQFLNTFDDYTGIFFSLKSIQFIAQFHVVLKNCLTLKDKESIINQMSQEKAKLHLLAYCLRLLSLDELSIVDFLKMKKINMEIFSKLVSLIFMKNLKINFDELILSDNQEKHLKSIEEKMLKVNKDN